MAPQHTGDLLHRSELRAHGSRTPGVQKLARPIRRGIGPEKLEVFLEQITPDRAEIVLHQLGQADFLLDTQVLRALQEPPPSLRQNRLIPLSLELPGFLGTHIIDRLVQMGRDMEPIQDMESLARLFRNHLQVRSPHVTADKLQRLVACWADPAEEPQERADGSLLPHPQQSFARGVNLVHQRQILMASLPLDLIDADRMDPREVLVRPPPAHGHLHRPEDVVPQLVRKAAATSVQLKRLAHRARNQA